MARQIHLTFVRRFSSQKQAKQSIKPVKGFHDLFPPLSARYTHVENQLILTSKQFAYQEVRLPIVESSRLYQRSINESEIVRKELFSFDDQSNNQADNQTDTRSNNNVSLRPEGTSGLVRALINNQAINQPSNDILRYFYTGPMFRRERPQKGRTRQFTQFGIECVNDPSINADIECIDAAVQCLTRLDIVQACTLHINSLGDEESRTSYQNAFTDWLTIRKSMLSADSRARLESGNVLRILDSKDVNDQSLVTGQPTEQQKQQLNQLIQANSQSSDSSSIDQLINQPAPLLRDYLNQSSKDRFASLQTGLNELGIDFIVDPYLVRGLDYYDHTAFEFKTHAIHQTSNKTSAQSNLTSAAEYASQSTVLAGGRYDGLFTVLGGPRVPAVGWAAGVDRLILLQDALHGDIHLDKPITFAIIAVREKGDVNHPNLLSPLDAAIMKLASQLRRNHMNVIQWLEKNKMPKQMAQANKFGVHACIIVGQSELDCGVVQVKWMQSGQQEEVTNTELVQYLDEKSILYKQVQ